MSTTSPGRSPVTTSDKLQNLLRMSAKQSAASLSSLGKDRLRTLLLECYLGASKEELERLVRLRLIELRDELDSQAPIGLISRAVPTASSIPAKRSLPAALEGATEPASLRPKRLRMQKIYGSIYQALAVSSVERTEPARVASYNDLQAPTHGLDSSRKAERTKDVADVRSHIIDLGTPPPSSDDENDGRLTTACRSRVLIPTSRKSGAEQKRNLRGPPPE
ncbi:hypothetical protein BU26DRAFT_506978 [Trematosphaeria pertusa]|uniref:Uncharacterized protein n=1 Tax=Trematosphaeria pertusa TaxID=390896 RepID=A0A6A6I7N6_9PLEO|nr:uncharacterized protein BU26DRAFT_506978 [Trematosphaeria pertusa]KAF2246366.1 hypothetical protein BU26DRAFT_506978 [Trematosphaeria pertusa]